MEGEYDYLFKVILIGDSSVGKSCILLRFVEDMFTESYMSTIGVDFRNKIVKIDGERVKLQIWDTAGQERYRTITTAYYRGAHSIIVVYDVTDRESFASVSQWLKEIKGVTPHTTVLLVGNKIDSDRVVSEESGRELALALDVPYNEVSAKTGENVERVLRGLAELLLLEAKVRRDLPEEVDEGRTSLYPPKRQQRCC